jgi:hypothetical protein
MQADVNAAATARLQSAVATARGIYLEAIDANPSVTMLRCALAELEESAG